MLAAAVALSATACAPTPPQDNGRRSDVTEQTRHGRVVDGYTYTSTPVEVALGPSRFKIPANYFDNQIGPFGEGLSLKLEWPGMEPTQPGARAAPRTNDFRREISVSVDFIDRLPIAGAMARRVTNDAVTPEGSLERRDPTERLELRVPKPDRMGLTPYDIDQNLLVAYAKAYEVKFGRPHHRNPAFEPDWYVARADDGEISTFIKCDNAHHRGDGVTLEGDRVISEDRVVAAGCTHYFVDLQNNLSISLSYKRVFLKDWKRMEEAVRRVLKQYRVA